MVDFEFRISEGGLPEPVCMVAKELKSGVLTEIWEDELLHLRQAPFRTNSDSIMAAYYASAELGCFQALGWLLPTHILDLYAEFRNQTNGLYLPNGNSLLGCLTWYRLDSISVAEKESYRELILRGNYTPEERGQILRYCESDVLSLEKLIRAMGDTIPVQALLRGRYMKAAAVMERNGIPIDVSNYGRIKDQWGEIQNELIAEVDRGYGVFERTTFKLDRFATYRRRRDIPWPVLGSGTLALDEDTFREQSQTYPELEPLRQLRHALSQMRLSKLAIGPDGRNRCLLSAFAARTGRNQPSNSKFIFGPAVWQRSLIKPEEGNALAYVDWEQQEFGIAAALSHDLLMMKAYQTGDPYMEFARMAKAVPLDATKKSHPRERELFKGTSLAVQYLMGPESLAARLGITTTEARNLLKLHREVFRKFWSWSDAVVDYAMLNNRIFTVFGWHCHVTERTKERSLRNFPMQANGAEMLRLACSLATEQGIKVCAPVHDALLIEAGTDEIEEAVLETQKVMQRASEIVLSGFPLRSEVRIIRFPDRYSDERGTYMWNTITGLLKGRGEVLDTGQV